MSALLSLIANPLFLRLGLFLVDLFIANKSQNDEAKKKFAELAEALRTNGIISATKRYDSEAQLDSANKKWDELEKPKT